MDAKHFRKRAARARELAKSGDDPRLAEMLLEVARDLDAEAEAIDAERDSKSPHDDSRVGGALSCRKQSGSLLWPTEPGSDAAPVQVIKLSLDGAELRTETVCQEGSAVVLDLPEEELRLSGCIVRSVGLEVIMVFAPESVEDPALGRYLRRPCSSKATEVVGAN